MVYHVVEPFKVSLPVHLRIWIPIVVLPGYHGTAMMMTMLLLMMMILLAVSVTASAPPKRGGGVVKWSGAIVNFNGSRTIIMLFACFVILRMSSWRTKCHPDLFVLVPPGRLFRTNRQSDERDTTLSYCHCLGLFAISISHQLTYKSLTRSRRIRRHHPVVVVRLQYT